MLISALLPQSICVGGIYQSVRTAYLTFADFEEVSNLLTDSMAVKLSLYIIDRECIVLDLLSDCPFLTI